MTSERQHDTGTVAAEREHIPGGGPLELEVLRRQLDERGGAATPNLLEHLPASSLDYHICNEDIKITLLADELEPDGDHVTTDRVEAPAPVELGDDPDQAAQRGLAAGVVGQLDHAGERRFEEVEEQLLERTADVDRIVVVAHAATGGLR